MVPPLLGGHRWGRLQIPPALRAAAVAAMEKHHQKRTESVLEEAQRAPRPQRRHYCYSQKLG